VLSTTLGSAAKSTELCSPVHPNQSDDAVKKTSQVKTSTAYAELALHAENKIGKTDKEKKKGKTTTKELNLKNADQGQDSQIVNAWKAAHLTAGLKVPMLTALECFQLGQLAKGKFALDYKTTRDVIIPQVVGNWPEFCKFAQGHLAHIKSKAPFPVSPHIGFLLKHKHVAFQYSTADEATKWVYLHDDHQPKFGPLPKGMPKPPTWNTPIWKGHPKGTSKQ
jgi:hypothetical protein